MKKDIVLKILIVLSILFWLKCCCGLFYTSMTHLSPEDLLWTKCATRYPSGVFVNDSGGRFQLFNESVTTLNSTNPFCFEEGLSIDYEASSSYSFKVEIIPEPITGHVIIQKRKGEDSLFIKFRIGATVGEAHIPQDVSEVELRGRVFQNCIVFQNGKNARDIPESIDRGRPSLDQFIISRDYGLVYFKLESGEEFFRNFKKVEQDQYE